MAVVCQSLGPSSMKYQQRIGSRSFLTSGNRKILGKHKGWSKSWLKLNPTCEQRIWTDADLDELVRTKSPEAPQKPGG